MRRRWVKPQERDRLELADQLRVTQRQQERSAWVARSRFFRRVWWLAMGLATIIGGLLWLSK